MLSSIPRTTTRLAIQQKRTFIEAMNKMESGIAAEQTAHNAGGVTQGAANPTYLKGKEDRIINTIGLVIAGAAAVNIGSGLWHMAHGTGKKDQ